MERLATFANCNLRSRRTRGPGQENPQTREGLAKFGELQEAHNQSPKHWYYVMTKVPTQICS
jgi:hypothetical protein